MKINHILIILSLILHIQSEEGICTDQSHLLLDKEYEELIYLLNQCEKSL